MVYGDHLLVNNSSFTRRGTNSILSLTNSNTNLKSGYAPIDDVYLYKTGIRGHKKYMLYLVVAILFLFALANLLTTFVLLGVLRLGYGMESLEFIPPGFLLRFLTRADFSTVVPMNGMIGGFRDRDLNLIGNTQSVRVNKVILEKKARRPTLVEVDPERTSMLNVDSFKVVNPVTGHQIFNTEYTSFELPKSVKKLNVKHIKVNKIESPASFPLTLASDYQVRMRGNEGLHMEGMEVVLSAGRELFLKSRNSSIYLDGYKGVLLNVEKLPKASDYKIHWPTQYKVCICMPSGRLFRVPLLHLDYTCANAVLSGPSNPCQ